MQQDGINKRKQVLRIKKPSIRLYKCRFGKPAAVSNRKGVSKYLDAVAKLRKANISYVIVRPFVHPFVFTKQLDLTGRIFIKLGI
jgi:hypothetical protein